MKRIILVLFILISSHSIGQEILLSYSDIYLNDSLTYNKKDNLLFSGSAELKKNNGVLVFKKDYENGCQTKDTRYYNKSAKGKISKETYYYSKHFLKKQAEVFFHSTGEIYLKKYFDLAGKQTLEESFDDNGKLIYSCEYKNGKKNGKEFCITKKCDSQTDYYVNGKIVK